MTDPGATAPDGCATPRRHPDALRRSLLVAAAALPAACAAPSGGGGPAEPVALPRLRVGDRWRYQLINRFRNSFVDAPVWEVVSVEPELRLKVSNSRGGAQEERWAAPWSALEETIFGLQMIWAEPVPLVPAPIGTDGGSRTSTTYRVVGDGRERAWSQRLSAGRWESIEVPAGRYECLRISRVVNFVHPDTLRASSTRSETLWYAPAVGRWVQREWRGDFISLGQGQGNPAEGLRGAEDWQMLQLTAWLPAPTSG
jgi:hypothetical protein